MNRKVSYRRVLITNCSAQNHDFVRLFTIFSITLKPDMRFREFKAYYYSEKLDYIDATLIMIDGTDVGFCAAAFYCTEINEKRYTVGRAATGILPEYRGETLPKWKLYKKYIQYWLKHPLRHTVLSAYVANPFVYSMICKYTGIAFPRQNVEPPAAIIKIKDELLKSQNLLKKEAAPFVVEIHFNVSKSESDVEKIYKSENVYVKYYLSINPKFTQQYGVLVIIPINLRNVLLSTNRFIHYAKEKKFIVIKRTTQKNANNLVLKKGLINLSPIK